MLGLFLTRVYFIAYKESGEGVDLEQLFYDLYVLLDRHQAVYLAYVSKNKSKSVESTPVEENGTSTPAKLTDEAMKFLKNLIRYQLSMLFSFFPLMLLPLAIWSKSMAAV